MGLGTFLKKNAGSILKGGASLALGGPIGLSAYAGYKGIKEVGKKLKPKPVSSPYDADARGLIDILKAQSEGRGPSLVGEQAKQAADANLANTISAIKATGGMSQALKNRAALRAGERSGSQVARDTMLGKMKERQDSRKLLTSAVMGARGQDIDKGIAAKQRKHDMIKGTVSGVSSMFGLGAKGK